MLVSYLKYRPLAASDGYERRFDSRLPHGSVARSCRPGPLRAGFLVSSSSETVNCLTETSAMSSSYSS